MELIYIWINQTRNRAITDCGVCFNKAYEFSYNKDRHELTTRKKHENVGLFTDEVITGISAIVGNNGSGKTTILDHIFNASLIKTTDMPNGQIKLEIETIEVYIKEVNGVEKIFVYSNLDGQIKIKLENLVENDIVACDINKLDNDYFRQTRANDSHPNSISKIFLTNSGQKSKFFHEDGDGKEHNVSLNPKTIENLSRTFYSSKTQFFLGTDVNNLFKNFQKFLIRSRSVETFQSLCDICYYNNLHKKGKGSFIKANRYIRLSVTSILNNSKDFLTEFSQEPLGYDANWETTITKEIQDIITYSPPKNNWGFIAPDQIDDSYKIIGKFKNRYQKDNLILQLLFNLVFELRCCGFLNENDLNLLKNMNTNEEIKFHIKSFINTHPNDELRTYYYNAINEIEELEKVLLESSYVADNLGWIKFDCDPDNNLRKNKYEKPWKKVYEYIEKYTRSKSFFVLKYLNVEIEPMSSGERALLNFFSWLHILPFFDSIKGYENGKINKNVLILIDEIELYCHPEWQRRFIDVFLNELKEEFQERMVQIIFTTHSPIVLSDIPDDNVVYLKNRQVANRVEKTFAQNIYTLYNDAFFLEDSLGERSKKIMEKLNENLNELEVSDKNVVFDQFSYEDRLGNCTKIVEIIGEPIIRKAFEKRIKKIQKTYQSENLRALITLFENLEKQEQTEMILYIIDSKS